MHDFVTKLALLSRILGSVWHAIFPCPSGIISSSASKAEKVPNFIKPKIPKEGARKNISGVTKASAFEWYA